MQKVAGWGGVLSFFGGVGMIRGSTSGSSLIRGNLPTISTEEKRALAKDSKPDSQLLYLKQINPLPRRTFIFRIEKWGSQSPKQGLL